MPDKTIKEAVEVAPDALEDSAVIEALLVELAALPRIEYDQKRKEARKRLGVRYSTLDAEVAKRRPVAKSNTDSTDLFSDPEPWPEPVNGAALLDAIAAAFERYVVLPDGGAETLAMWTLHAHAHEAAQVSPVLCLTSPVMECGKSTCLTIVQVLTPRALPTANITAAALFRAVEKWRPTVLIDEADNFLRDNDELRGVLNSGHARASAFVVRTVGEDHEPKHFRTWAPKAVALIGALPNTLAGRSITVRLRRKRLDEIIERLRLDRMGAFAALSRQAARWAADNLAALCEADPDVPEYLHNRVADNWRPLIAIADRAGGDWPTRARETARALSSDGNDEVSAAVMLLADIHTIMGNQTVERIASADLVEVLVGMEDRPWPEWKRGKPITTRGVARLLARFEIRPQTLRVDDHTTAKGYRREDFKDAVSRYLPDPSVTTLQPLKPVAFSENPSVTSPPNVTDENCLKPASSNGCNVVTDEKGGTGEKWGVEI